MKLLIPCISINNKTKGYIKSATKVGKMQLSQENLNFEEGCSSSSKNSDEIMILL